MALSWMYRALEYAASAIISFVNKFFLMNLELALHGLRSTNERSSNSSFSPSAGPNLMNSIVEDLTVHCLKKNSENVRHAMELVDDEPPLALSIAMSVGLGTMRQCTHAISQHITALQKFPEPVHMMFLSAIFARTVDRRGYEMLEHVPQPEFDIVVQEIVDRLGELKNLEAR
jgi:hypothetical protein